MNKREYFAALEGEKTATELLHRAECFFKNAETNGYMQKLEESWEAYHGAHFDDFSSSHTLTSNGEQGELTNLPVNHYRNFATHIITMITAARPKMDARAINSSYSALTQAEIANGILDYYMRDKKLENYLKTCVEYAVVYGSGFLKMDWNQMEGDVVDVDPITGEKEYLGDIKFSCINPFNIYFDPTKDTNEKHNWMLTRTFQSRADLMAQYPEMAEEISNLASKEDYKYYSLDNLLFEQSDDIPVYEFYHKPTPAMPDGRYMQFLSHDIVLIDADMPYKNLPIYRISAGNVLGTPYGYTPMFDLLPLQDAMNVLYSTIFTNNQTFGVQNIMSPRGADVDFQSLAGGLNFIEYNEAAGKPEAMQFTASSPETYKLLEMLERNSETLSGVNSVSRGNPEKNVSSGTAMAMIQSMALQFISGLQHSYVRLVEDVGTGIIDMLRDFAAEPRVVNIVGKKNRTYAQEFTGATFTDIGRVVVDVGNPLAATHAGKMEIANQLLQYQLLKDPKDYMAILQTGNLTQATEEDNKETFMIDLENERLADGNGFVKAIVTDAHMRHIMSHKSILADARLRGDVDTLMRINNHIMEHITILRTADPQLLTALGEQPMAPMGGTPNAPHNLDPNTQINNGAQQPGGPVDVMEQPIQNGNPADALGVDTPDVPQPPGEFANMPIDPSQM